MVLRGPKASLVSDSWGSSWSDGAPASIRRLSYISVAFYYRNLSRRITRSIRSVFLPRAFPAHQNDRTPPGCSVTERKPRCPRWRGFVHFTPEWNRGSAFFSAFWLRSSVVSVLISLISDSPSIGGATDQSYVSPGLMIGACVDHKADGLGFAPPPRLSTHRLSNQLKFLSSIPLFLSFSSLLPDLCTLCTVPPTSPISQNSRF